jgi:hypothetical protein
MSRDEIWRFVEERKWAYRGKQSAFFLRTYYDGDMKRSHLKEDSH